LTNLYKYRIYIIVFIIIGQELIDNRIMSN